MNSACCPRMDDDDGSAAVFLPPWPHRLDARPPDPPDPWPAAMVRMALAEYRAARAVLREANAVAEARPHLERWTSLAVHRLMAAQRLLLRAILLTDGSLPHHLVDSPEKHLRPARGISDGDRILLAVPDPGRDALELNQSSPSDVEVMCLVEVPASAIVDVRPR